MNGKGVRISVVDQAAQYPLKIDPTWSQVSELTASDGAADEEFGGFKTVAISGSTAIVGSPFHTVGSNTVQGAVYVFNLVNGVWKQSAELTASDGAANLYFGQSVAIDGSTIVVGAVGKTVNGNTLQGAAYVFTGSGSVWSQVAEFTAADGTAQSELGVSVAVSGSRIVVGAYGLSAYVLTLSGGSWTETAELHASDSGGAVDGFGFAVDISGLSIVVGAYGHEIAGGISNGVAYVFGLMGGSWTQTAELSTSAQTEAVAEFGFSVAISGSTLVVGDDNRIVNGNEEQGAAYVYSLTAGSWALASELTASDGTGKDYFGYAVSIADNEILVGAFNHTVGGNSGQGAAYLFNSQGGAWPLTSELTASDGVSYDQFGAALGISGSNLIVGAGRHQVGSNAAQGVAYMYVNAPAGAITPANTPGSGDAAVKNSPTCSCGGPITMSTGTQWLTRSDLVIPGRGEPLSLSETYSSTAASIEGQLGYAWSWSYGISLTNNDGSALGASPTGVRLNEETEAQDVFSLSGTTWSPVASRVDATLTHNANGTWSVLRGGTETLAFNSSGQLTGETDLNGETTTVTYPSSTTILVTDPAGRTLTATLNTATHPLITKIADSSATPRTVSFVYNAAGDLTSVTNVVGGITSYGYDSSHHLVEERSPRYYASGSLPAAPTSCTAKPPADITSTVYDSNGRAICQWDPDGRETTFAWVDDGLSDGLVSQATMTDPKGNVTVFEFQYGELISKTEGYGTAQAATWSYEYDPATLGQTWTEDPNGNVTTAAYDASGSRLTETDPLGRTTTWTYNAYDEVTSETLPAVYGSAGMVTTSYTYDEPAYSSGGHGNLTTVSTPMLSASGTSEGTQTTHYVHGSSTYPGDVTSMIDPGGNTWTYTYDAYGDKLSQTAPATSDNSDATGSYEATTKWAYNTSGGWVMDQLSPRYVLANPSSTTCTTPAVGCTLYTHDNLARVLVTTDGNGHTTTNNYDPDGNLSYFIDGNGKETKYTYDPAEQLTVTTRPDGTTLTTNYWPDGSIEDQVDGAGGDTYYTYDPLGHVTAVTDPGNRTTGYLDDGDGNLLVKSDPGITGCTTSSTTSGCTVYSYDSDNEQLGVTYNNTNTPNITNETYDADGRRIGMTEQHGSGIATSTWAYDSLSDLTKATDINGASVSYGYDSRQDQTSMVYPGSTGTVTKTFDAAGREASLTDWLSHTTNFTYDADSDLGTQMSPTSGTAATDTYGYDNADASSSINIAQGTTSLGSFAYGRDGANQVTSVTSSGVPTDSTNESYNSLEQLSKVSTTGTDAYDTADNPIEVGPDVQTFGAANQLQKSSAITLVGKTATVNTGTSTTLTLPAGITTNDQIIAAVTLEAGASVTTPTGYTLVGTYTAGTGSTENETLLYRHTATGATTSVTFAFSVATNAAIDVIVYRGVNPTGPIDQSTTASAAAATTVTIPPLTPSQAGDQLVLIEGATGQSTAGTFNTPPGMTARTKSGGTAFEGAIVDQELDTAAATGTKTETFSQTGQLVGVLVALTPATTSYSFDARGNRTAVTPPTGTATDLSYDQADRLISATTSTATATYTYNGDGLRMSKTVGGTTETYTYDQTAGVPAIITDGATNYIYGPQGLPLEQVIGSTVLWYHHDQLGSTRILTNSAGAVVGTATYNAYGQTTATTGSTAPLGFAGSYTDIESGYLYLNARYYDPSTAQFMTRDPLDAQSRSAYGYADNDPVNGSDPSGLLCLESVCLGFHPGAGINALVNIGRGASFGLSDTVANALSPGASCTVPQNGLDEALGAAASLFIGGESLASESGGAEEGGGAASQMERVGAGLKDDPLHRAASWVVDDPAAQRFTITGGDGVQRALYQLPGEVNGKPGVFEWIIDDSGGEPVINHQRFISGGEVTGSPNQRP
jgi:RHS repeat-associated protein